MCVISRTIATCWVILLATIPPVTAAPGPRTASDPLLPYLQGNDSQSRAQVLALLKDEGRPFSLTAAQAKLKTGRLAVRATEEAVQIHGGYGYIEEYPVCRFYRDAKILTIGEGTDEVQQMVIARALGA